jgi:uncharacterized lipoprotein YddW (UPF0748 family)
MVQKFFQTKICLVCLVIIGLFVSIFPYQNLVNAVSSRDEIRGVWITNVDSDVLFSKKKLKNAVNTLHNLNFNTLYPTVWNWGYTLYPSSVAKKAINTSLDPTPGLKKRDILKEITTQGHKQKMKVIPWFEFGFMSPADATLVKRHPQWILQRQDGTKIWNEGPHKRVWLNPFRPDVQKFIMDLILEIVNKYDVDGIQFDDHFGFPSEFGYDTFTVALYQREHSGQKPPIDSKNPDWIKWRSQKITDYLIKVNKAIKKRHPKAIISVAPNPWEFSLNFYLSDWKTWQEKGLIDELIVQVYRDDLKVLIQELERPEVQAAKMKIPTAIGLLTGVKPHPVSINQITEQVAAVRERNFAGISFFFYESLWLNTWNNTPENMQVRQAAFKQMFGKKISN